MAKRAILVTEYFPPEVGGVARWFDCLIAAHPDYDWTVIAPPIEDETKIPGRCRVIRPSWWRVPASIMMWRTALALYRLRREISIQARDTRPDVIHAMPVHFGGLAALQASRRAGIPLVVHIFGEELAMLGRSSWRRGLIRRVLARADAIVANSPFTMDKALSMGAAPERTRFIHGIDTRRFVPPNDREAGRKRWGFSGRKTVLFVGRIVERKGLDRTIEAIRTASERVPGILLAVAGDGPDRKRIERLAAERLPNRMVRFLGRVPDEDLPSLYGSADLFVTLSRELAATGEVEGFGLVFLEAAACGTPSVAGRSGGTGAAVRDGETGILVDPNDPGEAAEAMVKFLSDESYRTAVADRALDRVRNEFSRSAVRRRMDSLIHGVISPV